MQGQPTTEDQWRQRLTPQEYAVLRQAATEPAFTGVYTDTTTAGIYHCRACDAPLFDAAAQFASGCGWPAFWQEKPASVHLRQDRSHGMLRTEVRCAVCESHLGHLFTAEGYDTPIDQRFCINSLSLRLREQAQ